MCSLLVSLSCKSSLYICYCAQSIVRLHFVFITFHYASTVPLLSPFPSSSPLPFPPPPLPGPPGLRPSHLKSHFTTTTPFLTTTPSSNLHPATPSRAPPPVAPFNSPTTLSSPPSRTTLGNPLPSPSLSPTPPTTASPVCRSPGSTTRKSGMATDISHYYTCSRKNKRVGKQGRCSWREV